MAANNEPALPLGELSGMSPERIIAWFEAKGFRISWDWRDTWQEAHTNAFAVAKAVQLDVLADLRNGIQRIYTSGVSKDRWKRDMENTLRARGWWGRKEQLNPATGRMEMVQLGSPWRLETIYRTNAQVAFNRGRWQMQNEIRDVRPFWRYVAIMDSLTRPEHATLNGKVYDATSPIWGRIYPPNGFNCRCRVTALTPREMRRKGLQVEQSEALPDGFPDDGWNYNPAADASPGTVGMPRVPQWPGYPQVGDIPVPQALRNQPLTPQLVELTYNLSEATGAAVTAGVDVAAVEALSLDLGLLRLPDDLPPVDEP
jgi:SPP1 gp7 family putative phage head morphogenesis protein